MPMYRKLLEIGIVLFVHSDWGHREIGPIRRGLRSLAADASNSDDGNGPIDEWIVRNKLLYSSLSLDHVVRKLLPAHLRLLERRQERARRLFEG
jgi:hypothetical protein